MHPDVVIAGAGAIGLASALRLAQAGLRVTLVDRGPPGGEASSASAGMLSPQAEAEAPSPTVDLGLRSRAGWRAFAGELRELAGIDPAYRASGVLWVALDEEDDGRIARRLEWQRAAGLAVERLAAAEVARIEPALAPCRGALLIPDDHQVDAALLCRALVAAAVRAGVALRTGVRVTAIALCDGRAAGVIAGEETIAAGTVVVAAGAWASQIPGAGLAPGAIEPVRGQIACLAPRPSPLGRVVFSSRGYLVPRADGRVLAGSTMERAGYAAEVTAGGLAGVLAAARDLAPALAEAPVAATWAGLRPITGDGAPILGAGRLEGVVLAAGSGRKGILHTPVVADLVRDIVTGAAPPIDLSPFSPLRAAVAGWPTATTAATAAAGSARSRGRTPAA